MTLKKAAKFTPSEIESIFACPACEGQLCFEAESLNSKTLANGRLSCRTCGHVYQVNNGVFYLSDGCKKRSADNREAVWELEKFKNMFVRSF